MDRRQFIATASLGAAAVALPLAVAVAKPKALAKANMFGVDRQILIAGPGLGDPGSLAADAVRASRGKVPPCCHWISDSNGYFWVTTDRRTPKEICFSDDYPFDKSIARIIDEMIAMFRRETGVEPTCLQGGISEMEAIGLPQWSSPNVYKNMVARGLSWARGGDELVVYGYDENFEHCSCTATLPPGLRGPIQISMKG